MNPALFRHGTSDKNIWESVALVGNEYRLGDHFDTNDVILDLGAQTGSFSYACIQRGAQKVIAFEPDPDNFAIFRKQLKDEIADGRVEVYPIAVSGSSGFAWRKFSGVVQKDGEVNHGGAFLLTPDGGDYGLSEYIVGKPFLVPSIGVAELPIPKAMNLRLAKLDIENSEASVLPTLVLQGWDQIVGEYHPFPGWGRAELHAMMDPYYKTETVPHPNSELGLFFCKR